MTTSLSIEVKVLVGADIPNSVIPDMVRLANKIGIPVEASLNDVTTVAQPGDDPFDLAVAFRRALKSKSPFKMAFAKDGKEVLERP